VPTIGNNRHEHYHCSSEQSVTDTSLEEVGTTQSAKDTRFK